MDKKGILEALIAYYTGGNKSQFAKKLGVKPQTINTWDARGTFDLELIYAKCEYISADWLLTGEGPMLKSSTPKPSEAAPKPQTATTPPPSSPRREKDGKPSAADDAATFLAYIKDREDTHRAELDKKDNIIEQKNLEIRALDRKLALTEGENRHLSLDNDRLAHDLDTLRQEVAHLRSTHP